MNLTSSHRSDEDEAKSKCNAQKKRKICDQNIDGLREDEMRKFMEMGFCTKFGMNIWGGGDSYENGCILRYLVSFKRLEIWLLVWQREHIECV